MLDLDQLQPGVRLVVRYRRAPQGLQEPGPPLSDALGHVLEITPEQIAIQTRKGPVQVPRAAITHAKLVPAAPPRRTRKAI